MHLQKNDSEGPYRLLYCSGKGNKWGVMQELEKGVEPNVGDYDKRTALHLAACEGCTEIVLLLLEKGAYVNSVDRWGRTPLSDARSLGHEEICKILQAHGGIDPVGLDSLTPCYEIDHNEVNLKEETLIGEGAYGEVYLDKWRGTEVAAKTIRSPIASNPTVKFQEEMLNLPLAGLEAVLSSDDLQVTSEDAVYDFVLKWARTHYPKLEERREILGTRLGKYIRFPYMSCRKLKKVLTCTDFDHEFATRGVIDALFFKSEAPHRQRGMAAEESPNSRCYLERVYKYRPVKVVEFEVPHPQCIVYLDLKR